MPAGASQITTGHDGALLWRWELAQQDDPEEIESAGVTSRVLASVALDLKDGEDYLIRLESLGLPPKDRLLDAKQTGSALCICLQGSFLHTPEEDEEKELKQAEAWFEAGRGLLQPECWRRRSGPAGPCRIAIPGTTGNRRCRSP